MTIVHDRLSAHLNYFLSLEADIQNLARWIEFCEANESTYSIELARLLMTAAAEVDVIAKAVCRSIAPQRRAENVSAYQEVLCAALPHLPTARVDMPRYGLKFRPWSNWQAPRTPPDWWTGYNKVKHHRGDSFQCASLKNVLNATAALLLVLLLLHRSQGERHFPLLTLFVPHTYAGRDGQAYHIHIPDGSNVPWA